MDGFRIKKVVVEYMTVQSEDLDELAREVQFRIVNAQWEPTGGVCSYVAYGRYDEPTTMFVQALVLKKEWFIND